MSKRAMEYLKKNRCEIEKKVLKTTGRAQARLDFHLELTEQGFSVVDRNSGCGFFLCPFLEALLLCNIG
jgi:hypothetical protein